MDVAAVVLEDGAILRVGETLAGGAVEPECLRDTVRVLLGVAIDVDPEQLPAAQPLRTLAEIVEMLDLVTVEEDRFAHLLGGPEPATLAPAIRGAQEAPSNAGPPHQQDRTQSEHVHYLPVIASTELN